MTREWSEVLGIRPTPVHWSLKHVHRCKTALDPCWSTKAGLLGAAASRGHVIKGSLVLAELHRGPGRVRGGQWGVFLGDSHAHPIKAEDPFLQIQKKILWWTSRPQDKSRWPSLVVERKRGSHLERKGKGVRIMRPTAEVSQNPKGKGDPPRHVILEVSSRCLRLRGSLRIGGWFWSPSPKRAKVKSLLKCFLDLDFFTEILF